MKANASEYWIGSFQSYLDLQTTLEKIEEVNGIELKAMQGGQEAEDDEFGEPSYMMTRAGNVAIIDIKGTLTNTYRWYNQYYGIVSYPEIKNAVIAAVEHTGVSSILLSVDSPGGAVSGISELSEFLNNVKANHLPISTHVGGSMNSGGYWLGSIGEKLVGTRLSQVGSIGVISVHMEYSKMLKDRGIETTVIRKGKYKALGNPYEPLTPEAKDIIEKDMEVVYSEFIAVVATNLGVPESDVRENMAEGQVFWGLDAKRIGLLDEIGTLDSLVSQMHNDYNASNNGSQFNAGELTMSKTQVLTPEAAAAVASGASVEDVTETDAEVSAETGTKDNGTKVGDGTTNVDTATGTEEEPEVTTDTDTEAEVSDDSAVVTLLKTQLAEATAKVTDLTLENSSLKKEGDSLKVDHEPLREIAVEAISKMQLAMGSSPVNMTHVSASSLVEQYATVQADFQKRFKVGASAKAEDQEDDIVAAPVNEAAVSATTFSKK